MIEKDFEKRKREDEEVKVNNWKVEKKEGKKRILGSKIRFNFSLHAFESNQQIKSFSDASFSLFHLFGKQMWDCGQF